MLALSDSRFNICQKTDFCANFWGRKCGVKNAYYKYNGMSGDNKAEWDAFYYKSNEYYKTLKREDRLSAC